jgi:hypothetical protein
MAFGIALIHHSDRQRGFDILRELRATCTSEEFALNVVPIFDVYLAREKAERGETDVALQQLRAIYAEISSPGHYGITDMAVAAMVETLLGRGHQSDIEEAAGVLDDFAKGVSVEGTWASRDLTIQRLRAMLARARGDEAAYQELRDRYRAMANDLGFEGHMAWAAAIS